MLAVLADDLTGALDASAPFAARGMHVEVALTVTAIARAIEAEPAVLTVNLGSRELDVALARARTAQALAALPPATKLFKKIDSRLKGHIAAELDVIPFEAALVAPAIPNFGRIAKDGHIQGFGVARPISIRKALGRHSDRSTVPDTLTQDNLRAWVVKSEAAGANLLVGARGLAEALADALAGGASAHLTEIPQGAALFVIGSHDPITLAQVDELQRAFDVNYLPAPNGEIRQDQRSGSMITVVQAVQGDVAADPQVVSRALAKAVVPEQTQRASTLLLSGGATAEAVLEEMGIDRFRLLGECLPGLGLAHAQGHCIITKSGGFGGPDTLSQIAARVMQAVG
ncbi:four-carbon acid sugar kinase family protein [Pseudorhizobium endolithicum]|uniref:Four-carbon acid sugar kinase family protein n=1 Tax=Pseudorhizobium endolithicum TaxID=1191678 RepID=A0ABN7JJZ1_9HYPH|nr:four-carbon acid sugar kinase family protein [Pseudorhizobium endolithicum]CAD7033784.1 four-carbon acid sugar kinase family protein [Pseudorhizobium endolithicum]